MLVGAPPFSSERNSEVQRLILESDPYFPDHLSQHSIELMQGLLQKNPLIRLGSGANGSFDVKQSA